MKLDTEGLSVKMGRNISKLMEHTQSSGIQDSEVKYFQSAVSEYRGPLPRIIPVVVGLEGNNANELISLFAAMKTLKKNVSKDQFSRDQLRSINEQLEKHPSQGVFYKEIMLQLGWYQRMLPESKHTNKEALLKEVDSIIAQFASISSQKEKIDLGAYEKDGILAEVRRLTER